MSPELDIEADVGRISKQMKQFKIESFILANVPST